MVCCSDAGVVHSVKLPVQFIRRIIFDASEGERPSASNGAELASDSSPGSKVPFCAVVSNVAGLVSGDCSSAALAFRNYVVIVEICDAYAPVAEMASHIANFFLL